MRTLEEKARGTRPYVDRLLHDEELRDNLQGALRQARSVLSELRGPSGPLLVASRLATDKDLQEQIHEMVAELREARDRLQGKKDHTLRNLALIGAGAVAAFMLWRQYTEGTDGDGSSYEENGR